MIDIPGQNRAKDFMRISATIWLMGKRTVKCVVEDYEVYHRTFSSIVNTIVNAGLLIEECEESHVSDEMRKQYPAQFGGTLHRPDFIVFRCKKQS